MKIKLAVKRYPNGHVGHTGGVLGWYFGNLPQQGRPLHRRLDDVGDHRHASLRKRRRNGGRPVGSALRLRLLRVPMSPATHVSIRALVAVASAIVASSLLATASASASAMPEPEAYNRLLDVSCASTADCWAVGSSQDMNNNVTGETLRWNGSTWVAVSSPAVAGATLDSVSCTSSSNCWAAGNIGNGQTFPRPLIVRWNGSSWVSVAAPHLRQEVLQAISCSSSSNCFAVGTYKRNAKTLALHWNGSKWTTTPTPTRAPSTAKR